ncbi:hypothetical protein LIMHP_09660 [Leptospira interrogans serovar Manilae]|nr:hypothetical protein LIMLP_09655 [Leptospira interrogans serovar Manilae]AKP29965.1 hypothetical protein LIMHP_09660 [Leptospira interrogans serovar Manilae]
MRSTSLHIYFFVITNFYRMEFIISNTFKLFIGSMFQGNRTKFTKIFYFMNKKAPSFQKAL